jgi:ferric-dicitrate binding protein FerR (iron transport regulator)
MNILRYFKKYMSVYQRSVYKDYELQDFLMDEFFVRWVKNPTPETSHFWDKWIAQHPEKLPLLLKSKQLIDAIKYENKHEILDKEYTEIYESIVRSRTFKIFSITRQDNTKWLLNVAAILLLVVGVVAIYSYYFSFAAKSPTAQPSLVWVEKYAPKGTKLNLTLPDGSRVKLNAGSSLKYAKSFIQDSVRRVFLTGEAFFEVVENKKKPFEVQGGGWKASVLGTSFMVRTHADKPLVALLTGKLMVQHQKKTASVTLHPLEMAIPTRKGKLVVSSFQPEELLAWKEGKIVFKNTPFHEVIDILENWYGIEIHIEEGLVIPGDFSGIYDNETLQNVLRGLATTSSVRFEYKIQDKKVTLMPVRRL